MQASRSATRHLLRHATRPPSGFVCRSCLSRRSSSTSASPRSPPPPPPTAGFTALKSRRLISVSGPDAAKYLQGVVTANIINNNKTGFYTAFLNAQGRVLHDVFIYPDASKDGEGFLIEVDATEAERLTRHIKRYKLRAKLNLRLLDDGEATVWQAWDDSKADFAPAVGMTTPVRDPRSPMLGYRVLTPGDHAQTPQLDLDPTPETSYRIRRYLQGVAEGQTEILREHALPAESNMDVTGAIDFRKGCYVGQELTIRTRHRGVVRKRILPCVLYDHFVAPERLEYKHDGVVTAEGVPPETSIGRATKRGRSTGKWLSGVGNIGLALCRLEIMTDLTLPGEPAAALESGNDEFVLTPKSDEDVGSEGAPFKVKAFVPDWLRQGLAAQTAGH
ncbi:ccr4 associated factor [Pyricularia oryzae]